MKKPIIHYVDQGTLAWLTLRKGKITSSRVSDIMSTGRGGQPSKTRLSYMYELIANTLSLDPIEGPTTYAMQIGREREDDARSYYQLLSSGNVQRVGYVEHGDINCFGCSPDGLIGDDGGLEIKCPLPHTAVRYLDGMDIPKSYYYQIQSSLLITQREWWDFVVYCPEFKHSGPDATLSRRRIYPDIAMQNDILVEVKEFCKEMQEKINHIKTRGNK